MRRVAAAPVGEIFVRRERIACGDQRGAGRDRASRSTSSSRRAARVKSALPRGAAAAALSRSAADWRAVRPGSVRQRSRSSAVADARGRAIQREQRARAQREHIGRGVARQRLRNAVELGERLVGAIAPAEQAPRRPARAARSLRSASVVLTCSSSAFASFVCRRANVFSRRAQQESIAQFAGRLAQRAPRRPALRRDDRRRATSFSA